MDRSDYGLAVAKRPEKKPNTPARERFDLRLPPDLRERLEAQADRFGLDLSAYVRLALVEKVERDEATNPSRDDE